MEILGLSPYIVAIFVAALGVACTNIVGWLKSESKFNIKRSLSSAIIGLPVALIFVATELKIVASANVSELEVMIIIAGLISQVAGFDILVKNSAKLITKVNTSPSVAILPDVTLPSD